MADFQPSMGYLVHWAARVFVKLADRRLKPLGLSSAHLPVITALMQSETMSQKALTEVAAVEQPTMAATLARMVRDGIIERRDDPRDRRSSLFSLTPTTRRKVDAVKQVVEGINRDVLRDLPAEERQQFRARLQTMIRTVEEVIAESSSPSDADAAPDCPPGSTPPGSKRTRADGTKRRRR